MDEDDGTAHPLLLPATSNAPRLSRQHLAGIGSAWAEDTRHLAELLTSELVTNAVRYGDGVVGLTVEQTGDRIRVAVRDANPTFPTRSALNGKADRGRGLHLVDRLASRWGCEASAEPPGKTVWFELHATARAGE